MTLYYYRRADGSVYASDRDAKENESDVSITEAEAVPQMALQSLTAVIQRHLDSAAISRRYDNIHTACGWAGAFADAGALKSWGAACWAKAAEIETAVLANQKYNATWTGVLPTEDELLAELPVLVLP